MIFPIILFGQDTYNAVDKREKVVQDIGDVLQFAPTAASICTLIILEDKQGSIQFLKSFALSFGLTYALKFTIDKNRPIGRTDGLAFPSGHTSNAFQGASFLQRRYGWVYGIPAYLVASFVAYSRIHGVDHRHDGYDILAGAIIGIGSTYFFTKPYQKTQLEVSFNNDFNGFIIGINYKF
ncbi:phosphatase PAP2 family protein [Gaetbulibacter sp. M235]|uniref:phosphatase PAP2 family protein n=1 Tax=Gaetbulibacter sp. M235 TaxID=3126510 RepID=UPI00374F765E